MEQGEFMTIDGYSNSFILRAAEKNQTVKPQAVVNQPLNTERKEDVFEKKRSNDSAIKNNFITTIASGVIFAAILFLPEFLIRRKGNIAGSLDKLRKYQPLIGNKLTSQSQVRLKNGKVRINFDRYEGKFKYRETVVLDGAKIIQRIISKKEQMVNGKYILVDMKAYKGDNLLNNLEILNNEEKYLVKCYRRTKVDSKKYNVTIYEKGKDCKNLTYHTQKNGEPVLIMTTNNDTPVNTIFLYSGDKCVGTDKQIIPNNIKERMYNILTIPSSNVHNYYYDFAKEGSPYSEKLLKKLRSNF